MRRGLRRTCIVLTGAAWIAFGTSYSDAHKPITSPFTFNEDVFPIVKERCGACHHAGGVAPMSLMTHGEAVPWGESIRAELMSGHMPPWQIDSAAARFRNVQGLSGRELNVLLTWASGGTPPGDPEKAPSSVATDRTWPLGPPDLVLPLPGEGSLAADAQEQVTEFTVRPSLSERRLVRAVDLLPGTPAIVRSATVSVRTDAVASDGRATERLIALWLPGDHPVPADEGTGYELPQGAELIVRVRYRKTWEYENRAMSDRSTLGLYFAREPATAIEALELSGDTKPGARSVLTMTMPAPARAIAIYPDPQFTSTAVSVTAIRPDNSREELIAFRPHAGWARRYWFREPLSLARGTRIEVTARNDEALLPPGALPPDPKPGAGKIRLTLNVLPGT